MDILQQFACAAGLDFAVLTAIGFLFALYRFVRSPSMWLRLFGLTLKCACLFALAFGLYFLGSIGAAPTTFFFSLLGATGVLAFFGAADIVANCREIDLKAFRVLVVLALAAVLFLGFFFVAAWLTNIVIAVVAFLFIVEWLLPVLVMLMLLAVF